MSELHRIEDSLVEALRTIRVVWPALLVQSEAVKVGAASSDPITGLDRRVSLRAEVTLTLNGWARVVVEDRGTEHGIPLGTDTIGLCVFLERHAQWFSGHVAAADALEEIRDAAAEVKRTALPYRRDWMPLGTCPLDIDSPEGPVRCGGQVRAYPLRDPVCMKCGTEAVATWWERVMFPDAEASQLVTADEIVALVHRQFGKVVKPATIRQWIARSVIEASGTDDKGRTVFDRGAVVYALARRSDLVA